MLCDGFRKLASSKLYDRLPGVIFKYDILKDRAYTYTFGASDDERASGERIQHLAPLAGSSATDNAPSFDFRLGRLFRQRRKAIVKHMRN